ncbi:hypothetical protein D3C87_737320 [compost metagenome]
MKKNKKRVGRKARAANALEIRKQRDPEFALACTLADELRKEIDMEINAELMAMFKVMKLMDIEQVVKVG